MKRKVYYPATATEESQNVGLLGDVFSDYGPIAVTKSAKHRRSYSEPCDFDCSQPADAFSETSERPKATRRYGRQIYYDSSEREMGGLQNWPGDVFSETDQRFAKRRKRIHQETVEAHHDLGTLWPGDVFSETDTRTMHLRKRIHQPWQDDLSTFDVSTSVPEGPIYFLLTLEPMIVVQLDIQPVMRFNLTTYPGAM